MKGALMNRNLLNFLLCVSFLSSSSITAMQQPVEKQKAPNSPKKIHISPVYPLEEALRTPVAPKLSNEQLETFTPDLTKRKDSPRAQESSKTNGNDALHEQELAKASQTIQEMRQRVLQDIRQKVLEQIKQQKTSNG